MHAVEICNVTNEMVAIGDDQVIRSWDLSDYSYLHSYNGNKTIVNSLKFTRNGNFLISANKVNISTNNNRIVK